MVWQWRLTRCESNPGGDGEPHDLPRSVAPVTIQRHALSNTIICIIINIINIMAWNVYYIQRPRAPHDSTIASGWSEPPIRRARYGIRAAYAIHLLSGSIWLPRSSVRRFIRINIGVRNSVNINVKSTRIDININTAIINYLCIIILILLSMAL